VATQSVPIAAFLKELMLRRRCLPRHLAADLGVSHTTVSRWLSGADSPNARSCYLLARYSGEPLQKILHLAGHLPEMVQDRASQLPDFAEYARQKYPAELDEDLITVIEELIRRRQQRQQSERTGKENAT